MGGPSLATDPPNAGIPERPFHQARPHVLEDRELVPTRILEEQTRSRRDLKRSAFGLPTAGSKMRRGRLEVPHLEDRHNRRRAAVVREDVLRHLAQPHGSHLRTELMVVPEERTPEDFRVVFEVPIEVAGADVQVGELVERSGHHLGDKSAGAMSLAGTGKNLLHTASSPSAWPRPSNPRISPPTRCSPNRASPPTGRSPPSRCTGPAWTRTNTRATSGSSRSTGRPRGGSRPAVRTATRRPPPMGSGSCSRRNGAWGRRTKETRST